MYKEALRQTWVEIDLRALDHNIKEIKAKVHPDTRIVGVVKADAYGHGCVECAGVLRDNGIKRFAVATIQEAMTLRDAGFKDEQILLLGVVPDICADIVAAENLMPVVCSYESAVAISEASVKQGKKTYCFIKIDTGMSRIGFPAFSESDFEKTIDVIHKIEELDGVRIKGLMSHFAASDEESHDYTNKQIQRFDEMYERLCSEGINLPYRTIANSAAILQYPNADYDIVRPGIIMYGCYPSDEVDRGGVELEPVMSVRANIVFLKNIPAGAPVSYGRKFTAERKSKIATISIGYADGYSRTLSGKAEVLVDGVRCPIVGNICMDQCMVDVTDVPDVKLGDPVTIMGRDGDEEITSEELAAKLGTINYEVLCSFGLRLQKIYINK